MAIMRVKEMREMSVAEIDEKIKQLYTDYAKMKSQVRSGGAPENSGRMQNARKTIARLETVKHQKLKEAPAEAKPKAEKAVKKAVPKAETKAEKSEKPKTAAKKSK
jgi:large subunit ribosomal protein L29